MILSIATLLMVTLVSADDLAATHELSRTKELALAGDVGSQLQLGRYYFRGPAEERDYEQAHEWLVLAAQGGSAEAKMLVGEIYFNNVLKHEDDEDQLAFWLQELAEGGNPEAQWKLGMMYLNGWGLTPSAPDAIRWWTRAAEQGHSRAQRDLAWENYSGGHIPQDLANARKWLEIAAEQPDGDLAWNILSNMYYEGFGHPQDFSKSKFWALRGAAAGRNWAFERLIAIHEGGPGVFRDPIEICRWALIQAAFGASTVDDSCARPLSDDERHHAEQRARSWLEENPKVRNRIQSATMGSSIE